MSERYRTIKIMHETYPRLRLLAALTGESIVALIDRLVREALAVRTAAERPPEERKE